MITLYQEGLNQLVKAVRLVAGHVSKAQMRTVQTNLRNTVVHAFADRIHQIYGISSGGGLSP